MLLVGCKGEPDAIAGMDPELVRKEGQDLASQVRVLRTDRGLPLLLSRKWARRDSGDDERNHKRNDTPWCALASGFHRQSSFKCEVCAPNFGTDEVNLL